MLPESGKLELLRARGFQVHLSYKQLNSREMHCSCVSQWL
ncbi:Uncharacterised protein [Raoultella planticola]|nr:Uncharacterised protein [Raoultella planticola]